MLNIPLSDDTFRELRDFIYTNSGIFIPDSKKYLIESRILRVLQEKKLSSFDDYVDVLMKSPNGKELSRLFDAITTNETYFFREEEHFTVLTDILLPKLLSSGNNRKIKIWSAACSSGEEPYTIAMLLRERNSTNGNFTILASDLSEAVLNTARKGIYTSYAVRYVPDLFLRKYFRTEGRAYILNPEIKDLVMFNKANLCDSNYKLLYSGSDIIFCRNVLIYFDNRAKQKVVSQLYDCLNPGGYLFVGSSESLHNVTRAFRPIAFDKTVVYQKI